MLPVQVLLKGLGSVCDEHHIGLDGIAEAELAEEEAVVAGMGLKFLLCGWAEQALVSEVEEEGAVLVQVELVGLELVLALEVDAEALDHPLVGAVRVGARECWHVFNREFVFKNFN